MSGKSILPFIRPEIHGHRGCRGLLPENTLPAFLHALELGVDALELDVIISADRQVVVSHEPWLNPLICRGPAGKLLPPDSAPAYNLYQMPYAQIAECDCGHPHPSFPEQRAQPAIKPLLRAVLAATEAWAARQPHRCPPAYSIEVKSLPDGDGIFHPAPAEFLDLVLAEIDQAEVSARTTLLCFDPRILRRAHHIRPAIRTCLLVEAEQTWLPSLQELGFVPTTFGPDHRTVTPEAVRELRSLYPGLRLVPWTVNEESDFKRLMPLGLAGITTDYPDRLAAFLQS
ncbi:glycerophosphodiester phosphodiesterase [Hymenobacter sp. DH14]|uniref:Glycerophosphodiester phosphodiesterase n=1 Tax=Hymenobacter cyanobacteriorum TaxID=2926463 RepID=A0A9X1VLG4_9BACT|nr:glycerophosphodiester phosphodiesterase family protein [Hymenobacter cyanobacteriorum]MCI1188291.1 glycerophosphodiester phosphodiesterase [Hymenobacter cyanobacteriorum]